MMDIWNIDELAILSLRNFVFGMDVKEMREIISIRTPEFLSDSDKDRPFFLIRYHAQVIPIFNMLNIFEHSPFEHISAPASALTCVLLSNFQWEIGCLIDEVVDFVPVSLSVLQPLPQFIAAASQQQGVWGVYDLSGKLVPLLDFQHIFREQDIAEYLELRAQLLHETS